MRFLTPASLPALSADPGTAIAGDRYFNTVDGVQRIYNGTSWGYSNDYMIPYTFSGTLAVTTGVLRVYNNSGSPWIIYRSDVYVATAPTGAAATFGIRVSGAAAAITLTVSATTNAANSTTKVTVPNAGYLTVDLSTVGSTVAGANAMVTILAAS